ncbi:MAG: NAD(P)H-binding protein [Limosilactobacillus sp.]|uniref:NAD(P)H-binding protein n=1 Tax=Limosilactobacillus sp. TaxID=2773925 RepID=UPI00270CE860|nr:NAD(P)H-binding protein [Limosilactobacillus sp.]
MNYFITGATGNLGRKVVANLNKFVAKGNIRLGAHTPSKATDFTNAGFEVAKIDYSDVNTLVDAFKGIDLVIYIPSLSYSVLDRITEFEHVLEAMDKSNVKDIVAVSFFADQANNPFQMSSFYAYLPARLASSKFGYAVVKNSLYADPLVPYLPELIERKNVIYPIGDEAMTFISRENSAEAIANVAVKEYLRDKGQNYLLSMKQNYNMVELSNIMSEVTGEEIGYSPVTLKEFADIYRPDGDGDELASMYKAASIGLLNDVSNDFQHITGHEPQTMKEFLEENYQK